ncbi:TERPENE CYCLASE/MUTASE FAMILY MEMBER [Salix purpurea]|uniref:TERPENE CYCLASE/MUTASE FAMILY MEMBER n=1 Tax=Salix purpurea TaxID=77065 RepID=A0A9Q0WJ00_SALPP|nr:TERPENE CYCLASE/MUTASE FAMILY MEMBER [Salix purpurea]
MWKLEAAERYDPWLVSTNNFAGRHVWKFDPDLGTPEERAEVEKAREKFSQSRSHVKGSSDVLKNVQSLNMIANWAEDPTQDAIKRHQATVPESLWVAEDGMKVKNWGSQLWDSVFVTQAIIASNLTDEYGSTLRIAFNFIKLSQIRKNPSGDFQSTYHKIYKGSWTVSVKDQGWQVSDCTAEALMMPADIVGDTIEMDQQLYEAVDFLLTLQSENGGFRYVECTASIIQALALFTHLHPEHRRKEIETSVAKATHYVENTQMADGSWYSVFPLTLNYVLKL